MLLVINRFKQMLLNYCDKYLLFWDLLKTSKMFTYDMRYKFIYLCGEQYILQNTTRDITFNTFSIKINKLHGFDNMSFIISGKVFDTFELLN